MFGEVERETWMLVETSAFHSVKSSDHKCIMNMITFRVPLHG